MYALAAGAAGVSMLAMAQQSDAKVIYTPAHVTLQVGKPLPMDLNHDGVVDFFLFHYRVFSGGYKLLACQSTFTFGVHGVECTSGGKNYHNVFRADLHGWGADLRPGANINSGARFTAHAASLGNVVGGRSFTSVWRGPWVRNGKGVKNRYLGVKFKIRGRFHYGWARLTVTKEKGNFTATLTGYAYETIPGKGIIAGQTKGKDEIDDTIGQATPAARTAPTPNPATLGALALGAPGLSIWRREESPLSHR
jgi:hypothetical protein